MKMLLSAILCYSFYNDFKVEKIVKNMAFWKWKY